MALSGLRIAGALASGLSGAGAGLAKGYGDYLETKKSSALAALASVTDLAKLDAAKQAALDAGASETDIAPVESAAKSNIDKLARQMAGEEMVLRGGTPESERARYGLGVEALAMPQGLRAAPRTTTEADVTAPVARSPSAAERGAFVDVQGPKEAEAAKYKREQGGKMAYLEEQQTPAYTKYITRLNAGEKPTGIRAEIDKIEDATERKLEQNRLGKAELELEGQALERIKANKPAGGRGGQPRKAPQGVENQLTAATRTRETTERVVSGMKKVATGPVLGRFAKAAVALPGGKTVYDILNESGATADAAVLRSDIATLRLQWGNSEVKGALSVADQKLIDEKLVTMEKAPAAMLEVAKLMEQASILYEQRRYNFWQNEYPDSDFEALRAPLEGETPPPQAGGDIVTFYQTKDGVLHTTQVPDSVPVQKRKKVK